MSKHDRIKVTIREGDMRVDYVARFSPLRTALVRVPGILKDAIRGVMSPISIAGTPVAPGSPEAAGCDAAFGAATPKKTKRKKKDAYSVPGVVAAVPGPEDLTASAPTPAKKSKRKA